MSFPNPFGPLLGNFAVGAGQLYRDQVEQEAREEREERERDRIERSAQREWERKERTRRKAEEKRQRESERSLDRELKELEREGFPSHEAWRDLEFTMIRTQDLESALRVAGHLDHGGEDAVQSELTCLDCVFWHGEKPTSTRGYGCAIWYLVQIEHGSKMRDVAPQDDTAVCKRFALGNGARLTCYDCVHWDQEQLVVARMDGCKNWIPVQNYAYSLKRLVKRKFGANVSFKVFESDRPFNDRSICYDFELDPNLPKGYGEERVRQAIAERDEQLRPYREKLERRIREAREASQPDPERPARRKRPAKRSGTPGDVEYKRVYVAGIPFEGRKEVWKRALVDDEHDIALSPEPENAHDRNAIAVYVAGEHGGYVPAKHAESLAPRLREGWSARVIARDISVLPGKDNPLEERVYVWLTLELRQQAGAPAAVAAVAAASASAAAEGPAAAASAPAPSAPAAAHPPFSPEPLPTDTFAATDELMEALRGPSCDLPRKLAEIKSRERHS